ncbi:hypothetical protein SAMN06272735_6749 [Streptomyces sp. TLI_55]|uniref:hypothetical protein n=1 Tax=Streptomyces sp. TLI_55 TaxID=1938861 RepID=UPI000BDDB07B|nr:hypothetical protein [Streptomyces sp. TLI_55]SNX64921.1 hypothetical protein SAMN06272735_6749 [Streptomyces sp. TLI_55]
MSFGGPNNPYQPPYQPPPPNPGPYGPPPPPPPPNTGPYVPPQPYPYPNPYPPYVPQPQPRPGGLLGGLRGAEWPPLRDLLRSGRQRIHGCVWLFLLVPCTWFVVPFLMVGYVFARSARVRAHRLFPPRAHRLYHDPQVTRLQKARTLSAAAMTLALLVAYGKPEDFGEVQAQYLIRLVVTPPLLLLSAPVVIAVLYRWAPPHARPHMGQRMRAAGKAALWYVGAVTAIFLIVGMFALLDHEGQSTAAVSWLVIVLMVPLYWLGFFLVFATGPAVRSGFNSAEVHAALPALLTGVLVWEFAIISLAAGGPPPGPPLVSVLAFVGGPASVCAVAWWEVHRLQTRHGVRLRG